MNEPLKQFEVQLGHMCNNRCVFCVSGQRTAMGEAGPSPTEPILEAVRTARAGGHTKITLLGGEPTLQPGFLDIVRECVRLGFEEIVVFTNGAKTARPELIDEILATGGNITWRISIQGATLEAHERTTKKEGSFGRILRTMIALRERKQRITVNMCVVASNYESIDQFPALVRDYGVEQLHLDLVRPLDAGIRSEDELRAMMFRYGEMVPALERMVRALPADFDVNLGNLPYCIAPQLAHVIHHDGEATETVAIDDREQLSRPWNKYLVKRRDKGKPTSCRACVFDARCSGVFEHYARFHGIDELVPVTGARLAAIDPSGVVRRQLLATALDRLGDVAPTVSLRLARLRASTPFGELVWTDVRATDAGRRVELTLLGPAAEHATLWLGEDASGTAQGGYTLDGEPTAALREGLGAMIAAMRSGARP